LINPLRTSEHVESQLTIPGCRNLIIDKNGSEMFAIIGSIGGQCDQSGVGHLIGYAIALQVRQARDGGAIPFKSESTGMGDFLRLSSFSWQTVVPGGLLSTIEPGAFARFQFEPQLFL
jgi:hypothetical protein